MAGEILSDSSLSHIIEAPIELIDIPAWLYSLSTEEYRHCSPQHIAAGATFADDGTRMSINVEMIGGSLLVQNYVEHVGERNHVKLVSITYVFSPNGRATSEVTWDLSVRKIDDNPANIPTMSRPARPSHSSASSRSTASRSGASPQAEGPQWTLQYHGLISRGKTLWLTPVRISASSETLEAEPVSLSMP